MNLPRDLQTRPLGNSDLLPEAIFKDRFSGEMGVAAKIALLFKDMRAKIIVQVVNPIIIGRLDSDNDTKSFIDLNPFGGEPLGVSRRHLKLWSENNHLYIEDLGSTNGTFFNGIRLTKNTPQFIHHGDQIALGRFAIEIEFIVDMLG